MPMKPKHKKPNGPTIADAIHKVQIHLIETPSSPLDVLVAVAPLLSQTDYDDVVNERSLSGLCGHPHCPDRLPSRRRKYRMVHSKRRRSFLEESSDYCSQECLGRSREFKKGLMGEERAEVYVRKGKAVEILRSFGGFEGKVENVEDLISKLQIRDQVEKEAANAGGGDLDEVSRKPGNAMQIEIEARANVPQHRDRGGEGSKFSSNTESAQVLSSAKTKEVDLMAGNVGHIIDAALALSRGAASMTHDDFEMIAKVVENVVFSERKVTKQLAKPPKRSRPQSDVSSKGVSSKVIAALPKACDFSEQIIKQLEDVVITEKAAKKAKFS